MNHAPYIERAFLSDAQYEQAKADARHIIHKAQGAIDTLLVAIEEAEGAIKLAGELAEQETRDQYARLNIIAEDYEQILEAAEFWLEAGQIEPEQIMEMNDETL